MRQLGRTSLLTGALQTPPLVSHVKNGRAILIQGCMFVKSVNIYKQVDS